MTTTTPTPELVALLELSERATAGPWTVRDGALVLIEAPGPFGESWCVAEAMDGIIIDDIDYSVPNAQFIAALVNWFRSTRAATVPQGVSCEWVMDAHDGSWDTGCGNKHQFSEGDAADNLHLFCPYCGGHLVEPNYDAPPPAELGKGSSS